MKINAPKQTSLTNPIVFVGLDVHKDSIVLAAHLSYSREWLLEKRFGTSDLSKLRKYRKKLSKHGEVNCCYEASGAGFYLYRLLRTWGFHCEVIASTLIPRKPGEKKKCDRLDARKLSSYYEAGLLTYVSVPDAEREAVRAFVRCRQALREDVTRAKHQLIKFLDTKGLIYREGNNWTGKHRTWLNRQKFDNPLDKETFDFYYTNLETRERRLEEIDKRIHEISQSDEYRDQVHLLCGFRGIKTLSAMVLLTELGDITRFKSPKHLMSYVGLTPSVNQSGESGNRARSITKAGSARCRHVLVQAAWNNIRKPVRSRELRERQEGLPAWAIEHSWNCQKRLYKRFHHLELRTSRPKAAVAIARELIGFLGWALYEFARNKQQ